jgi:hypothetical protein
MSIVVRFSPSGLAAAKYDETIRQLDEAGIEFPPEGCPKSTGNGARSEVSKPLNRGEKSEGGAAKIDWRE